MAIHSKQLYLPDPVVTKLMMDPVSMKVVPAGNLFLMDRVYELRISAD